MHSNPNPKLAASHGPSALLAPQPWLALAGAARHEAARGGCKPLCRGVPMALDLHDPEAVCRHAPSRPVALNAPLAQALGAIPQHGEEASVMRWVQHARGVAPPGGHHRGGGTQGRPHGERTGCTEAHGGHIRSTWEHMGAYRATYRAGLFIAGGSPGAFRTWLDVELQWPPLSCSLRTARPRVEARLAKVGGTLRWGTGRHGTAWYDMVQNGAAWYGMV